MMTAPIRKSVHLYYDVISPHAWIAFELLSRYKQSSDVRVTLKPICASELHHLKASSSCDNRRLSALCQDAEKLGKYYGVPLKTPKNPEDALCKKGSVSAMRLLTAISQTRPELTEDFSRSLWNRVWNKDEDIFQRKSLIQLGKELGQSERTMESLLEKTKEKGTTLRLRSVTEEAIRRGAVDAPTIVVDEGTTHSKFLSGSADIPQLSRLLEDNVTGQRASLHS